MKMNNPKDIDDALMKLEIERFTNKLLAICFTMALAIFNIGLGAALLLNDIMAVRANYAMSIILIIFLLVIVYIYHNLYTLKIKERYDTEKKT